VAGFARISVHPAEHLAAGNDPGTDTCAEGDHDRVGFTHCGAEQPFADGSTCCVVVDHDPARARGGGHEGFEVDPDACGKVRSEVHRPLVVDEPRDTDAECRCFVSSGLRAGLNHQLFDNLSDGGEDPVGSRRIRALWGAGFSGLGGFSGFAGFSVFSGFAVRVMRQRRCGTDLADNGTRGVQRDSENLRSADIDPERQARRASTRGRGPGRKLFPGRHVRS
jgi:hypothetical protein